jgi:hypothetical protein
VVGKGKKSLLYKEVWAVLSIFGKINPDPGRECPHWFAPKIKKISPLPLQV